MHPIKDWNISEVTILSGYIRFSCFWLFIVLICIPAENELWARRLVLVIAVSNTSLNCAVYFHFTVHAVPYLCLDYCCRWFQSAPLVCLRYKSILKIKDRFELLSFSLIVLKSKSVNQHQTFNFSKRSYDKEKKSMEKNWLWQLAGTAGHFWRHCLNQTPFSLYQITGSVEKSRVKCH